MWATSDETEQLFPALTVYHCLACSSLAQHPVLPPCGHLHWYLFANPAGNAFTNKTPARLAGAPSKKKSFLLCSLITENWKRKDFRFRPNPEHDTPDGFATAEELPETKPAQCVFKTTSKLACL